MAQRIMPGQGKLPLQPDGTFEEMLLARRSKVYSYLDAWPGAAEFRPEDVHNALFSYVRRRGKALRPLLVLLCCGAVGGDEDVAVPAAAAVEVFHTWTLVHDDIIDRDDTRRGHPTVHAMYRAHATQEHSLPPSEAAHYGTAVAILAGDLQQSWTYALLADLQNRGVAPGLVLELVTRMATILTPRLLEGEMLDVQYSYASAADLTEEQIVRMLTLKTSALLEYAAWCGAKLGFGDRPDTGDLAGRLATFAGLCGTAFQLRDDLLGITADEAVLGKPVGSDVRQGKRTLIVHKALAAATPAQRDILLGTLGNEAASSAEIAACVAVMQQTGACDEVAELANSYVARALESLEAVPPSMYRDRLRSWAAFLLSRQS